MTNSDMRNSDPQGNVRSEWSELIPRYSQDDSENSLELEIFRSFEDLQPIQQEWDQFISSLNGEIFLTYDWCRIWWKYYGENRELLIFVIRTQDEIAAILPVFFERLRIGLPSIGVVKFVGSDHLPITFTVPIKPQFIKKIVPVFIDELSKYVKWDVLYIGAICGRYGFFDELVKNIERDLSNYCLIYANSKDVQTYFQLGNSIDDYIKGLGRRYRQRINRDYKVIRTVYKSINTRFATSDTLDDYFNSFVSAHQFQWQASGQAGHFIDWPKSYQFHYDISHSLVQKDRLRLFKIIIDSQCFGYKYGFKFGDTYCSYIGARSLTKQFGTLSFSKISFIEQARNALEEGIGCVDSMRGKYDHKINLNGQLLPVKQLYILRRDNFVRIAIFRFAAWMLDLIYAKIWRRRLVPRFGFRLKPFLAIWIKSHFFAYCGLDKYFEGKL